MLNPSLERTLMNEQPTILYVCVHNAGRSQIAAAYTRALAGNQVRILSGGSAPASELNPVVVQAMREEGIDITSATPTLLSEADVQVSDIVITMGCGDTCTIFPGKRYEDWKVDDPAGQDLDTVRRIREEIKQRVTALLEDLGIKID